MSKIHLVIPDPHAHPEHDNSRFDLLGKLILDLKPDVVVNIGDHADLPSLSSYDKGKASFHGKNYEKDITAAIDANERMWYPIRKAKKKMPRRIILEGNHEHRIKKVLQYEPHLEGSKFGISTKNLAYDDYYDTFVEYQGQTPRIINVDGINYAHYVVSGIMGRALNSKSHARDLTNKFFGSTTVGHSHLFDSYIGRDTTGNQRQGLVCGVFQDYHAGWAGNVNNLWTPGVCIKRGVDNGKYDLEFISMERLKKEYGTS